MVNADLSRNPKQASFFYAVMQAVANHRAYMAGDKSAPAPKDDKRIFAYGGGIRGGKTFVCLVILVILCKMFPRSRWHVIRRAFPDLQRNTEPSLQKIISGAEVRWKRSSADYYVQFPNGSRIYFMAEQFERDRDLNRFKGLETNGVLLEQAEELQDKTYQKSIERMGSYYVDPMPPGLLLMTFNPAFNWVKEDIYDPWSIGQLNEAIHFVEALPDDNPFVTEDQWAAWSRLDDDTYQRYIGGLWELKLKSRLFHAFDSAVHVTTDIELDKDQPVRLSYDFNTDPSTCVVYQTDGENYFHVLYEYRIEDGSTEEVCDAIVAEEWFDDDVWFRVTGDATGNNRWSGMAGRLNQYRLIKKRLGLRNDQFVVPKTNPWIADSRTLCNSVIAKLPSFRVHKRCKWTIHDLNFVKIKRDSEGKLGIQKTGKLEHAPKGAESMGHLGDCVRYGIHEALHDFVDIPRS